MVHGVVRHVLRQALLPHSSIRLPNNRGMGKELSSVPSMSSWRPSIASVLSSSLPEQPMSEWRDLPPDRRHRDQRLRLPVGLCWAVLQHW